MVSYTNFWVALSLIVSIAASSLERPLEKRAASLLLGYKAVNEDRAKAYIAADNTLIFDSKHSSNQLGPGQYISPGLGEWQGQWYCAILTSDPDNWISQNKMWLPETVGCQAPKKLWWMNDGAPANRAEWITQSQGSTWTTSNTILFSKIQLDQSRGPTPNYLQMLIPTAMLSGNPLSIVTQCASSTDTVSMDAIRAYGTADWYGWSNVEGDPQVYTAAELAANPPPAV